VIAGVEAETGNGHHGHGTAIHQCALRGSERVGEGGPERLDLHLKPDLLARVGVAHGPLEDHRSLGGGAAHSDGGHPVGAILVEGGGGVGGLVGSRHGHRLPVLGRGRTPPLGDDLSREGPGVTVGVSDRLRVGGDRVELRPNGCVRRVPADGRHSAHAGPGVGAVPPEGVIYGPRRGP
jgi:hypothetical protein